ncbi:DUF4373 domain-containing protein [Sphaerochaeta halotolerans]|jgi:hypothetical protein|uniref:DUF4373 domain-containing protein n=1 Tax=Sphaerochaeta halotolerans TaxID=2293840 RepID=A0A372MI59_9SPIR|nr:Lin1244/Lin1753 domain-containing protein [Sphaerochaeta halotolerans]RFU95088.1 DUF4373 domain-containing protein [Sphaerochaeta halotolerans]
MKTSTNNPVVFYFRHDISESQRAEVMQMRVDYKAKGYGYYNLIREFLASRGGIAEYNPKLVAKAISEDPRSIAKFLDDCINMYEIFKSDGLNFWSEELMEHANFVRDKSKKNSDNAKKRSNKDGSKTITEKDKVIYEKENRLSDCSTNAERKSSDSIAVAEQTLSDSSTILNEKYKDKEINICSTLACDSEKNAYGEYRNVFLSGNEFKVLLNLLGETKLLDLIIRVSVYKHSNNKSYDSDFLTIKHWAENDKKNVKRNYQELRIEQEFKPKLAVSIWDDEEVTA